VGWVCIFGLLWELCGGSVLCLVVGCVGFLWVLGLCWVVGGMVGV